MNNNLQIDFQLIHKLYMNEREPLRGIDCHFKIKKGKRENKANYSIASTQKKENINVCKKCHVQKSMSIARNEA